MLASLFGFTDAIHYRLVAVRAEVTRILITPVSFFLHSLYLFWSADKLMRTKKLWLLLLS
jgi:hypothetical protein